MFEIITDTAANIPTALLKEHGISVVPLSYGIQGEDNVCMDTEEFDGHNYYTRIREGAEINTSQVTPQIFIDLMAPILKEGKDVLYVGISSGISGTYNSSCTAMAELLDEFPGRKVCVVDSISASMAEGMVVLKAVSLRKEGKTVSETAEILNEYKKTICQVFTVDDLMHLKRTGRCSSVTAKIGTMLGIKPILVGNDEGKIVITNYCRGMKGALKELANKFRILAHPGTHKLVCIAHADAPEEAEKLAALLRTHRDIEEVMIVMYEPVTGAHVGPGAVALFFEGEHDSREKITRPILL